MAAPLSEAIHTYFPTIGLDTIKASSDTDADVIQLSQTVFPSLSYTETEKTDLQQETALALHIVNNEDDGKQKDRLGSLNMRLADRTTILGTKPSIADIVLYARLAPLVKTWSQEERTGEHGYHNIVRYVDFLQNSALVGLSISEEAKVDINVNEILHVPKPVDLKQEKERKKKEKAGKVDGDVAEGMNSKTSADVANPTKGAVDVTVVAGANPRKEKREKKEKAPKQPKQSTKERSLSPAQIDLRVGHILKAVCHPNADSLYVSTIAVGDPPGTENTSEYEGQVVRTVCSGLNGLIPLEEMQNRKIVAVCNLKPVTMRGIKSAAMVLAASPRLAEGQVDNHAGPVELVQPPHGSSAGQRIIFEGWDGEPELILNPKKKVWDMCQVAFETAEDLGVIFDKSKVEQLRGEAGEGKPALARLMVKEGKFCTVSSLRGAVVR